MKRFLSFLLVACLTLILLPQNQVVNTAVAQLGKPYHYTATGPNSFDCSGFTYYVFLTSNNIKLQRTAQKQGYDDTYIQVKRIRPGDLLSFNTNYKDADLSDHMGIAISDTLFIHCSSAAGQVKISSYKIGWYEDRLSWARRIIYKREESINGTYNVSTGFTR